jgi:hypothetical protein
MAGCFLNGKHEAHRGSRFKKTIKAIHPVHRPHLFYRLCIAEPLCTMDSRKRRNDTVHIPILPTRYCLVRPPVLPLWRARSEWFFSSPAVRWQCQNFPPYCRAIPYFFFSPAFHIGTSLRCFSFIFLHSLQRNNISLH